MQNAEEANLGTEVLGNLDELDPNH